MKNYVTENRLRIYKNNNINFVTPFAVILCFFDQMLITNHDVDVDVVGMLAIESCCHMI